MNGVNQIPDDSAYYSVENTECDGEDWRRCQCEACQGRREDYEDMMYERKRDEEFDK